jgi:hypothetical protein
MFATSAPFICSWIGGKDGSGNPGLGFALYSISLKRAPKRIDIALEILE